MEKAKNHPLLSATIAVVLSNIAIIIAIIVGIFGFWLREEEIVFMGLSGAMVFTFVILLFVALIHSTVRHSKISRDLAIAFICLAAVYLIWYTFAQMFYTIIATLYRICLAAY